MVAHSQIAEGALLGAVAELSSLCWELMALVLEVFFSVGTFSEGGIMETIQVIVFGKHALWNMTIPRANLEPQGVNQNVSLPEQTHAVLHLRTQGRKMAGTSGVSLKAAGSMAASINSWKKVACQRARMHGRVTVLLCGLANQVSYPRQLSVCSCLRLQCHVFGI